jgi:peptide/nickel transport system permease protein
MLETLSQDFILTARSKGLAEKTVLYKHALRNVMLPIITVIGMEAGFLLAGAVMTETVFSWPGLGRLMFDSIARRDYPVLMGLFIVISVTMIIVNLITDIVYSIADPRIRYRK